jgi:NADPH:quinone reductase-like Zn-dependent oxidoreductase
VVEGNDVAGYVEQVGEGVSNVKVGDRVAALTPARTNSDRGAYQEYTISPAHNTFRIGESVSFEDASTVPCKPCAFTSLQS